MSDLPDLPPGGDPVERAVPGTRRQAVLAVMCLGLLVVGIDGTIVNVALPTLTREIGATSSDLQWVVDAYLMMFASFLLLAGNTGDRLGRKRCFIVGLTVFSVGSLGCALVSTTTALIVCRAVQGLGAAFIMPATLSIITVVFRDEAERSRAIALWSGVSGLGVAFGPLLGGYLLEHFWWGSIFLVNVPIGIAAIVLTVLIVPESHDDHAPRLDLLGTVLVTFALAAVLYGIIEGPVQGWGSVAVVGSFVAGGMLLVAFVLWELRIDHPILDVTFFRNPRFTAASISVMLVFFAMFGSLFFVSQYLQFVLGYSALQSGLGLLPVAVVMMITAPASAKLVARFGTKNIVTLGLVLVAGALAFLSTTTVDSGYVHIAIGLAVMSAGMGLAMAPATDSIMGSLPPEKSGVGSAMNDTTREIGGALGVGILGSIVTAAYTSNIAGDSTFASLTRSSPDLAAAVEDSFGAAAAVAESLPDSIGGALVTAANTAFVDAFGRGLIVGAVVALVGAAISFLFLPARARGDDPVDALVDGAARRLVDDPEARLGLAQATLGLFADAGMSSLTYSGVAARSGVATATLERLWTSRIDAVTDAMQEVFRAHPVPDTGDLSRDIHDYMFDLRDALAMPRARQVLGTLVAEAASNPELATALRERVVRPRRQQLMARLSTGRLDGAVPVEVAADQLVGSIFHRALVMGAPVDDVEMDALVGAVLLHR